MATVAFSLPEKAWAGLNTRFRQESNYIDNDQFTLGSFNFLTDFTGAIAKMPGGTQYSALSNINSDQYEAVFTSGIRHFLEVENGTLKYSSGDGSFNTVTAGYSNSAFFEFAFYNNRAYFGNGVDDPQSYDLTTSYGGVTYTTPKTKKQGALVPTVAPTFNADSAGGSVPVGAHTYITTFLYYDSEESNGGPASAIHTVSNPNNTVNLKTIQVGGYGVTARKIYRDDNDGNYVLIGVISNNTATTFVDTVALGTTPLPLDNGLPPIYSLIVEHLDRLWVAGVAGNTSTLYWSEAGLPDIFSVFGFLTCNPADPITALHIYNDRVMVFNRHSMGQILNRDSADFRYSEITPNVGCIDNRSIKTRTIRGLPTVIWLSEFGWYEFNGSSINAISVEIDDQVQFNLQQGSVTKGQHTDTNQTDFQAGTASPGIDLLSIPGSITTKVPVRQWQTEADWEGGSSLTNVATHSGLNDMEVPTDFEPTLASGTLSGDMVISGSNLTLPVGGSSSGEDHSHDAGPGATRPFTSDFPSTGLFQPTKAAQSIIPIASGVLTSFTFRFLSNTAPFPARASIYNDSFGNPGSEVFGTNLSLNGSFGTNYQTVSCSVPLTIGVKYWIVLDTSSSSGISQSGYFALEAQSFSGQTARFFFVSAWLNGSSTITGNQLRSLAVGYTYSSTPVAESGQWISPVIDSLSDSISTGMSLIITGSYPTFTSGTGLVQGTNDDPTMLPTWTTTDTLPNPNGTISLTGSGFRYWRILIQESTSNNTNTPSISVPILDFNITATWISEVIDHTTDIVSLDQLILTATVPAGTTAAVTIATSTDNITYSSYTSLGSAVVHRYSKIKVVMTTTSDNVTSPTVSNVLFTWTLTSNLVSAPIDTGATPAGWDIFQDAATLNGGAITFYMRSATTSGGLSAASFIVVTNGAFPTVTVNRWAQWKVIITNSTTSLAQVASVTINWFITLTKTLRVASLFYKKRYYMAAAEFGQTANNVVYIYDEFNTWKVVRGVSIATLGLFFNEPYYGDAVTARVVKWLVGNTNVGSINIAMDVRTKAFSKLPSEIVGVGADEVMIRWIRSLVLKAVGTGARLTPTYSSDGGSTFLPMALIETGNAYVDLPTDGNLHAFRFVPVAEDVSSTRSILLRVTNNDAFPVSITNMKIMCITSRREVFNG